MLAPMLARILTCARSLACILLLHAPVTTAGCAGKRPFELPARTEVPSHPCADWGVAECERACNEEADGDACMVASIAHGQGLGGPKDAASMQAFERRACELGVALGCEYFANDFVRSEDPDELDLAREHYDRACLGGRASACSSAGILALRLDATGEPRDPRAAFERYQQACDGGEPLACGTAGDLLTFGIGTPANAEAATASFRKACDGAIPAGCHNAVPHAEHWLAAGTVDVLLEQLHAPDPAFSIENAPSGWHAEMVTRTCFTHASIEPVSVRLVESSGQPTVDAVVLGTLHGWRYRARPGWTFEQPVCLPNVFGIRKP